MIKFEGSYADFGRLNAGLLRENHHDFYHQIEPDIFKRQLKIYETHYPALLEELSAAADELKMPFELLAYEEIAAPISNWRRRVSPRRHGCTIFSVRENDRIFVGRNYDWLPIAREFFNIYDVHLSGKHRFFGFSDEGTYYRHTGKRNRQFYPVDALNDEGLYIGLTFASLPKWDYGLQPIHIIRYIAEHCATVRQALNAFEKIPVGIPKNFLIADAKGNSVVVEHAAQRFEVVHPDKSGILVHTNHALSPALQPFDRAQHDLSSDSFVRYAETKFLVAGQLPGFQFTDLWRILRRSHYVYNRETIWSLALELSSAHYNIYFDTVNGQKHQLLSFD